MKPPKQLLPILVLILVALVSLTIISLADNFQYLVPLGYLGAFLIMLLGNATIVFPVPGLIFIVLLSRTLDPVLLSLAAGSGAAIGELTGYFAGYSGAAMVNNHYLYKRLQPHMAKYGLWIIFIFSIIPNPVFDITSLLAGAGKIPVWKFLMIAWIGKTIQSFYLVMGGSHSIDWVLRLVEKSF